MGFEVFSPVVLDIQIWAYFDLILEKRQASQFWKSVFKSELLTSKKPIPIEFDLFITVGI